jgi:hypothetical protein
MHTVEIIQMGPLTSDLNLREVTKVANKSQKHFHFLLGNPLNSLGEPDTEGEYKVADLAKLVEARRTQSCADIAVGVTDSPLYWELFSGIDSASNNVVISTSGTDPLLAKVNKSKAAYVLVEIAAQLLAIEYRRLVALSAEPEDCAPPWHGETKLCLFDYCGDPPQTVKKLITPKLCLQCLALLESANIQESIKKACLNLAKRGVRARFLHQLLTVLGNPILGFFFGGAFSVLVLEGLRKLGVDLFWASLLFVILPLALIIILIMVSRWKSRNDLL